MGTTPNANLMACLQFTLLGTKLTAGYQKDEKGEHTFIFEDVDQPNEGITVAQLIQDVQTLMGNAAAPVGGLSEADIKSKLQTATTSTVNVNDIRIQLKTVFLDIKKPTGGTATVEYAFQLDVIAGGLIPAQIQAINVDRLTLAVWNTTTDSIKKQLALAPEAVA